MRERQTLQPDANGVVPVQPDVPTHFTAVLLAGGASRRLGRDKATLMVPGPEGPEPLWRHQLRTLSELGPAEVLLSGPARPGFPEGLRCVPDAVPGTGPVGGLAATLATARSQRVLVLAIDLPMVPEVFLRELLELATAECGVVPVGPHGYEPLVAVYPRAAVEVFEAAGRAGNLRLQPLVAKLVAAERLRPRPIRPEEKGFFRNWNTPADVEGGGWT